MTKKPKLIAQGAEATVYLQGEVVIKERIAKSYRHPQLDEQLRRSRTKKEAKLLIKAYEWNINVPQVLKIGKYDLEIEHLKGKRLSECLNMRITRRQDTIMKKLGEQTAKLHEQHIIHGDLTTSNVILTNNNEVFIIDFGLGFVSRKIEDKAVDLHLIKQALEAKHWKRHEELFNAFLKGYTTTEKNETLKRLQIVEARGRYRH